MVKKSLVTAAALLVLGGFVFGRDVFSYMRTSAKSVREAVKREVPLEFEVERAREMVVELLPDIRHHMHLIAEDQVDVEHFRNEITHKEKGLARQEKAIFALRNDLDSGDSTFVYASRRYTSDEVKRDLGDRFKRFKAANQALERDQNILKVREKALRSHERQLDEMLLARKDLELEIENLEANLKSLRAAEAVSTVTVSLDNSQLARTKKLIAELKKRIEVEEKMLDTEGKFAGLIDVETEDDEIPENITQEIDDYFSRDAEEADPGAEVADVIHSTL